MKCSFFEYNVAASGLTVARAGLDVTGNNIANAETPGYSKQYAEQRTTWPLTYYNGKGMVGTGAEIYGIGQMRNFYLDKKYWSEKSVLGEYDMKSKQLGLTEGIFNELSDTGLKSSFTNFFKKLQDLTTTSGDATYRTNVIQAGETLTKLVNNTAQSLKKQQLDLNSEIKSEITVINSIGQQIRSLNETIRKYELSGSKANDLRDERALLVDKLSAYVNVQVEESESNADYEAGMYPAPEDRGKSDKKFVVFINGCEFVNNDLVNPLKVVERTTLTNNTDVPGLYDVYFEKTNQKFDLTHPNLKGELKGLIDMRDGNNGSNNLTTNYKGVPYFMDKMNELVRVFARAINEGKDKDGKDIQGVTGHVNGYDKYEQKDNLFFTYDNTVSKNPIGGLDYSNLTCENFQINSDLIKDPNLLSSAKSVNSDESDNNVILSFLKVSSYGSLFKEGKLEDFVIGLSGSLGINKKQADNFKNNYQDVTTAIDNQRKSVSGVDLNEESINMMKYNQLYQASAKLMNIIDSIYDTCINRLGL